MKLLRSIFTSAAFTVASVSASTSASVEKLSDERFIEPKPQLRVSEPFLSARSRLIKQGWAPVHMHEKDGYIYDGAEKKLIGRHIQEVDSCSVDAGVNCIFYYRKRPDCLRIDTIGEQVKDMRVARWTGECPVKE